MKKLIASAVLVLGLVVGLSGNALAAPNLSVVTGTVRAGQTPINGATVNVTCNSATRSTSTDGSGNYSVVFNDAECPDNSTAKTIATKGGASGSNTGPVVDRTVVNVAMVDVNVALPEMGTVVGSVAAIGALGGFMIVRRKQLNGERS